MEKKKKKKEKIQQTTNTFMINKSVEVCGWAIEEAEKFVNGNSVEHQWRAQVDIPINKESGHRVITKVKLSTLHEDVIISTTEIGSGGTKVPSSRQSVIPIDVIAALYAMKDEHTTILLPGKDFKV